MTVSDFITPLASTGDQGDLREALITRTPYTFTATENPEDYVAVDAGTGAIPWALVWAGRVFYFDPDDNTSPHDGLTVIVTADGYRYKTDGIAGDVLSVKSRAITAPPATPAVGDAYLVPAGATGDWATHPSNIAVWTARGWTYIPPQVGQLIFVEAEGGLYHYGTGGAWVAGVGSSALGAGTVRASSLIGGRSHWVVVNQTTNTPPASPANGVAYIVGPSPTGAWSGQTAKIAVWEISAWVFYTPVKGWVAFDQSQNIDYVFNVAWLGKASAYDSVVEAFAAAGTSPGTTGSTGYTYSHTTAPNTGNTRFIDPQSLTVQAAYAGQKFEAEYSCAFDSTGTTGVLAVFIDSETNARDWSFSVMALVNSTPGQAAARFSFTLADTASHTIRIARLSNNTLTGWGRRRLTIRRLA